MQKIILKITTENFTFLDNQNLQCFIFSEDLNSHFKQEFRNMAKQRNKLVLGLSLSDCLAYGLDGMIVDLSKSEHITKDYRQLTKDLKGKIVGAICRNRRHEAMIVSECEPDFVVFRAWKDGQEKIKELSSWYNEMFLIQAALLPMENVDYQSFETDFVILDDVLFSSDEAKH